MTSTEITVAARHAVDRIIRDLSDRRGLDSEWDAIDDETRAEIHATWTAIIRDTFDGAADTSEDER